MVRKLIAGYVVRAILPYVFLCLFILTAVLFAQQTGRIAELALYSDVPLSLLAEVAAALLPNVLILTLPAAVLAGIIIGFARMGSDSEVVAMRAAGLGTWSILWPVLLIAPPWIVAAWLRRAHAPSCVFLAVMLSTYPIACLVTVVFGDGLADVGKQFHLGMLALLAFWMLVAVHAGAMMRRAVDASAFRRSRGS